MDIPLIIALSVLGLCFGSFVNAWVWRLKTNRSVAKGRSMCVHCKHTLAWYDLLPVVSWLLLKARCRYCNKPISWQYPLVELAVAAYFVGSYLLWPADLSGVYQIALFVLWLVYGVLLAVLFVYDLRWQLLPDVIVKPLIGLGALQAVLVQLHNTSSVGQAALNIIYSLAAITGLYGVLYWYSKGRWIGFGDVKLGAFLGLALGWQQALVCLVAANLIGLLVIIPGLLSGKLTRTSRLPFGPFLIIGFVIAGLFGQQVINYYLQSLFLSV